MPTLAEVYENHAEECLRAAAKADDPKQCALMLKLAVRGERMQKLETRPGIAARSSPRKANQ